MPSLDLFPKITQFFLPLDLFSPCVAIGIYIQACLYIQKFVCTYLNIIKVCSHVLTYVHVCKKRARKYAIFFKKLSMCFD